MQDHMLFFAWMLSHHDGGFRVSVRMVQDKFRVSKSTAARWRQAYFAARGVFPIKPPQWTPRTENEAA
jgi:transposase